MKKNILEELPWIGPTTRKKLLSLASSLENIRNLSEDDMLTVVNRAQLQTLRDHGLYGE
jgi:excinuclease UvrABC nuclease subunit